MTVTVLPGGSAVELSWLDNSSDPQEEGFSIERRPYNGVDTWHELVRTGQNVTSYTDTDSLHGMVTYTYRVGAVKD